MRPYFRSLDGLRCLAILPVIWHHSTPRPLEGVLGRGPLGVDLFFAISGFLITSLLLHERRETGSVALGKFWLRRGLRIAPLYYLVLGAFVIHALLVRAHGPARDHFLACVPLYATYTSNWFVHGAIPHPIVFAFAWSLAAEEQFYALWPPVLRFVRGTALPALVMSLVVVADQAAERGAISFLAQDGLALRVLRSFATPIGLGALLAIGIDERHISPVLRSALAQRWSSAVALTVVGLAAILGWPLLTTHIAMTALVGACALRGDHLLAPLLDHRAVRHVGTVSYGMYLLNVPVVSACRWLLHRVDPDENIVVLFVVSTAATIAFATIVFRFVESPFLALRARFSPSSPSSPRAHST